MPDLSDRIKECLPQKALPLIEKAASAAMAKRKRLYLVGGVVRDLLLGRPCLDMDLVLEGNAIEFAMGIPLEKNKSAAHPSFGTATIAGDGFSLDFVTARRETYLRPGALPSVTPSNINDDLFRRDFTINAMAIALTGRQRGQLIDPWGGQTDLENSLVRVLHDKSFVDDATRMLRAVRYEQRLGFHLENNTEFLLRRDTAMLDTISGDRIRHELDRILQEKHPERALRRAGELGILARLHPCMPQDGWIAEAFANARKFGQPVHIGLYYALFLYRTSEEEASVVLNRLAVPKAVTKIVLDAIALRSALPRLSKADLGPSRLHAELRDYSPQAVAANIVAGGDKDAARNMRLYLDKLRYVRPSLRGDDLVHMGAKPGPGVGELLSRLHQAKLDGQVTTKAEEVKLAHLLLSSRRAVPTTASRKPAAGPKTLA